MQKNTLYANLLSFITVPVNQKIVQQILRLLKNTFTLRGPNDEKPENFELKRLKLRNSYFNFFRSSFENSGNNFSQNIYVQYLKTVSPILQTSMTEFHPETRIE